MESAIKKILIPIRFRHQPTGSILHSNTEQIYFYIYYIYISIHIHI